MKSHSRFAVKSCDEIDERLIRAESQLARLVKAARPLVRDVSPPDDDDPTTLERLRAVLDEIGEGRG